MTVEREPTVRAHFKCENCRHDVSALVDEDWVVECPDCRHAVDVGVYLSPDEVRDLWWNGERE